MFKVVKSQHHMNNDPQPRISTLVKAMGQYVKVLYIQTEEAK